MYVHLRGPGSSVGIATDYGLDGPGSNLHEACQMESLSNGSPVVKVWKVLGDTTISDTYQLEKL